MSTRLDPFTVTPAPANHVGRWRVTGSHWIYTSSTERECCHCGPANHTSGPQYVCHCPRGNDPR